MLNIELLFWLPLFFFAFLEELITKRRRYLTIKRWVSNFSLLFINRYALALIIPISAINFVSTTGYDLSSQEYLFQNSLIATVLIVLLGYDFIVYWEHRLFHKFSLFWRFHRVHHSDLELDISTSVRQHPIISIITSLVNTTLFVLLGIPVEVFLYCILCSQLFSFFTHSNIKINPQLEKVLGFIFITPKIHTVHHLATQNYTDSNYGEIFSIWDKLFKSYQKHPSAKSSDFLLGLDNERDRQDQSLIKLLLNPFKK